MKPAITALALALTLPTADAAAQLLKDDFSAYTAGSDLNGQGGWTNSTSSIGGGGNCAGAICSNQKVANTPIAFNRYGTAQKSITTSPGRDGVGRSWQPNVTEGDVYAAFAVSISNVTCESTCSNEFGFFRLVDRSGSFSFIARLYARKASASSFQLGVEKGASGTRVWSTNAYAFNSPHVIVLKYTINRITGSDDAIRLYVDPDMSLPEPATAEISTNLGNDLSSTIDAAGAIFHFNSAGWLPVGNYGLLSVATLWSQLPFVTSAVAQLDPDLGEARLVADGPASASFRLVSRKTDLVSWQVTDATGKVVIAGKHRLHPGVNLIPVGTAGLPTGTYAIRAVGRRGSSPTVRWVR
jgi:hypothetical protein